MQDTTDTPFFHHVATLVELHEAAEVGRSSTRTTSTCCAASWSRPPAFFGYGNSADCIKRTTTIRTASLYKRMIDLMSHGKYSLYEPGR